MSKLSGDLFIVYDKNGTSYTKKIREQSGKTFVIHHGQVMDVVAIGFETITLDDPVIKTGKPIYKIIGEYSLQKTL